MAENRLIGDYPVIGIRPTIDGRRGYLKVRESLEEQTIRGGSGGPRGADRGDTGAAADCCGAVCCSCGPCPGDPVCPAAAGLCRSSAH